MMTWSHPIILLTVRLACAAFAAILLVLPAACSREEKERSPPVAQDSGPAGRMRQNVARKSVNWKVLLVTGDDSINAFDNARQRLKSILEARGVRRENIRQLSIKDGGRISGIRPTTVKNIGSALANLKLKKGDGLILHMTSHGSPGGFFVRGDNSLTPWQLSRYLDSTVKSVPQIVFVSACYSGIFSQAPMRHANRIVLTAARDDRNSFGCGVEDKYTFWDGCLIQHLPQASGWDRLSQNLHRCIRAKERGTSVRLSYPQAWLGRENKTFLPVLNLSPRSRRTP